MRGFARRYPSDVAGMVLVDAVHEDQHIVYGGQPHLIRESARGRAFPEPRISLDTAARANAARERPRIDAGPLDAPLNRLPADAQAVWRWAEGQPMLRIAQSQETDWSPEELARMHAERASNRATLGDPPLVVLARTSGGYASGMNISADSLERERRALQADLAALSTRGRVIYAEHSGHNIHVEDPALVVRAIRTVVEQSRER